MQRQKLVSKLPKSNHQEKSFLATLQQARTSGILNIANRGLDTIPTLFYESEAGSPAATFDCDSPRWWEVVDVRKLFVQNNKLSSICPELIAKLRTSLLHLDGSDNNIAALDLIFGELQSLQTLNLSRNNLSSLPVTFVNLSNLADLNLSFNNLSTLPQNWSCLQNLSLCNLSNNKLSSIPDDFALCGRLLSLDLSHNQLAALCPSVDKLALLQYLDASFNRLTEVNLNGLRKLQVLKIDNNFLHAIPNINDCCSIKELSACDNKISEMPVGNINCFASLTILNLRGNKISDFPDEHAAALKSIERLDLANNNLSMVPPCLGLRESLKCIILDGNPLRTLRRDIVNRGTVFIKQWLVSRLPEAALSTHGQLHEVPKNAVQTSSEITKPSGDQLNLTNVGAENVSRLLLNAGVNCKDIVLSKNRLSEINGLLGAFTTLCFLDLSCNLLKNLPDEIAALTSIRQLNISNNKFSGILPVVIYKLKNLDVLIASDNMLESVDVDQLLLLANLSVLDIKNNNFSSLPPKLALCPALKHLEVVGNPFKIPRPEIVRKGSLAVLEYLKSKLT